MNKLLTAYESACIFVELSPGPDKLLDEAVARLHEIDKELKEMKCKNCGGKHETRMCPGLQFPPGEPKAKADEANREFIADARQRFGKQIRHGGFEAMWLGDALTKLLHACDQIDRLEKELKFELGRKKVLCLDIDRLEAEIKELEQIIVDAKKFVKIAQEQSEALEEERNSYKEKLHDHVNTATLKELDVFLTHTKKIGKLKQKS